MATSVVAGQVRTVLAAGGGVLLALGVADQATLVTVTDAAAQALDAAFVLVGAGKIIVAAVWSWWEKRKAAKAS